MQLRTFYYNINKIILIKRMLLVADIVIEINQNIQLRTLLEKTPIEK